MNITRRLLSAILLTFAAAPTLGAEPQPAPLDLLFETPHLEAVAAGETLSYRHARTVAPEFRARPGGETRMALTKRGPRASTLVIDVDGAARSVDFDGPPGNPLLMYMLEQVVRTTAQATGGSPFYLRNRMKDALRDGLEAEGESLTMRPFAADPNRAQLGPFADLTVEFVVDRESPGMLRRLAARTDDGRYVEEIALVQ
jgi:hypothetical protein